jgi:hypothetical protein
MAWLAAGLVGGAILGGLLGGKSEIKIEIDNELNNIVNNTLINVVKIVTQSVVKVTSTILQEQIATVDSKDSGTNIFNMNNVQILDGAKISINQINEIKSTVSAVFNIIQDVELINKIQENIKNDVTAVLNQNATLQNDVRNAAYINAAKATSGEANALVGVLKSFSDGMFGGNKQNVTQTIRNKVRNELTNLTRNETDISNYIETVLNTKIEQRTINECFKSTSGYNIITWENVIISGKDTSIDVIQKNVLESYFSCFISSTLSTKVLQDVSIGILNESKVKTDQGIDVKNKLDNKLETDVSDTTTSWADNLTTIAIVAAICAVVGGIGLAFINMTANKNKKCLNPQDILDPKIPKAISNPGNLPMCTPKGPKGPKGRRGLKGKNSASVKTSAGVNNLINPSNIKPDNINPLNVLLKYVKHININNNK